MVLCLPILLPILARLFLVCLASIFCTPQASQAIEYLRDERPAPDSVRDMKGPLGVGFEVPKPPPPPFFRYVDDRLKKRLETLPSFWRDTHVRLQVRTYYFNRQDRAKNIREAWTLGGSAVYESGWWKEMVSIGAEVFTSQKLYGPLDRDSTGLLRPRQKEYTVVGRAYGQLRYQGHTATLFRQYYDFPYLNKQLSRMTPNTFEGYSLHGKQSQFEYIAGYVARIKRRNTSTFISMSEAAGTPSNRKRGLLIGGLRYILSDDTWLGAMTLFVPDVFNTVYAEVDYTWSVTQELGLKVSAQFTDQRSVGQALLSAFSTQAGGTLAALSYKDVVVRTAFSITAGGAAIRSPFGGYPGYLSLMLSDFNRADEKAWLIGVSYNFRNLGLPGLSFFANFARGEGARNAITHAALRNQEEFDLTVDYRVQQGAWQGLWFRVRGSLGDPAERGASDYNVRIILTYEVSLL